MRDLPPLSTIRVFDAAARHQNLSRAAEELIMTQSAVSYQIKQIEAFVGAPLFLREARGVGVALRPLADEFYGEKPQLPSLGLGDSAPFILGFGSCGVQRDDRAAPIAGLGQRPRGPCLHSPHALAERRVDLVARSARLTLAGFPALIGPNNSSSDSSH